MTCRGGPIFSCDENTVCVHYCIVIWRDGETERIEKVFLVVNITSQLEAGWAKFFYRRNRGGCLLRITHKVERRRMNLLRERNCKIYWRVCATQ